MKKQTEKKATMHRGAPPRIFQYAYKNRCSATEAEEKLWEVLRNKKLAGAKFRRQHAFGHFVLDFYCHSAMLSIEVDGDYHFNPKQVELDNCRTKFIEETGIKVIRFKNEDILNELDEVVSAILIYLQ
ncbi:MAG: endonuclease domain-containing protein [Saprospiraceae bacterium]